MRSNESCPFSDGRNTYVYASTYAVDCKACPVSESTEPLWLLFHLVLSFVLVAHVRWSHVVRHNHVCKQATCYQQQQVQNYAAQAVEKVAKVLQEETKYKVLDLKEDLVLPPTPALSVIEEASTARLTALRIEYTTYLQMIKVGLPRVVVNHKMRAENKDPNVLDELLSTTLSKAKKPAPIEIPPRIESKWDKNQNYTQKVEAFQRMLKVGVPRHLVESKAKQEGIDPADFDKMPTDAMDFVSASFTYRSRRSSISSIISTAPSTPDALAMSGRTERPLPSRSLNTGMRKKLHWSTTLHSDTLAQPRDSFWSHLYTKTQQDRVCISHESRQWMEKLFVQNDVKARESRRRCFNRDETNQVLVDLNHELQWNNGGDEVEVEPGPESDALITTKHLRSALVFRKRYIMLLDFKKSQNIAIVLARVKRSFEELTFDILTLNCNVLTSPALQSLIDMWPDNAEQEAIDEYHGDVTSLATAEQFLIVACKIPNVLQKLRCLQFKLDFATRVKELCDNLKILTRGIRQVCASDRFGGVLEYIFHLGNLLNFGEGVEYTEWIKSISISSLAKLSFTKAYDGRISFLQYVIQSIERDEPHLALFCDQLPLITRCSKLSFQSLIAEHQSLKIGLRMLINETQKSADFTTENASLRVALAESHNSMKLYAMEVEQELQDVHELVNALENERNYFYNYFEEEDTLPIDEMLGFIASFADEYSRERQNVIFRVRKAQESAHLSSVQPFIKKRHSL
ncbi:hypothetical protein CCR75_000790 [Bremia lactucae]|uniref:FH2 domain-containing protein n=1 Tax=Bremia lactucae TaxID=4779 RepID=A0A976NYG7_BRELC|nr:hypothetical protein CCR75_000790 [Bremia lactucae]